MRKLSLGYERSSADGEVVCFSKDKEGTLKIVFKTWDEKTLEIFFSDTIRFLDNNMYDISDIVQIEESIFLAEGLQMMYDVIPEKIPYKHYQFLNIDGDPTLEIIATDMRIKDVGDK